MMLSMSLIFSPIVLFFRKPVFFIFFISFAIPKYNNYNNYNYYHKAYVHKFTTHLSTRAIPPLPHKVMPTVILQVLFKKEETNHFFQKKKKYLDHKVHLSINFCKFLFLVKIYFSISYLPFILTIKLFMFMVYGTTPNHKP